MTEITGANEVRQCGDCGLCCKLLAVDEIDKPPHQWCDHFVPGSGCGVYEGRPQACSTFQCIWLRQTELGAEWKPNRAHFVMYLDTHQKQLVVNVDPVHANAWRKEPYLSEFRLWARRGLDQGPQLVVKIRRRIIAILPDREIDFGELADYERIRLTRHHTPDGLGLTAQKVTEED
jgi:hypothetical protein